MKRFIALCVMMLLLSSCSQKAAFEELADGACSSEQAQLVDAHISAQIDAMLMSTDSGQLITVSNLRQSG